ncbi:RNA polymerase sigma factor [Pseudonocardia sp. HH130630-07]|uniref:RNA polymerase sigma factor n=1 Tax=Pseudonocardia sp. HH130630-07 TaxID=1690815 RepID=UPI000814E5B2|nr:RNA polymerase sigma factor [Pseudonocardia sp. HH130630-07]ANY05542.1 RNA polymerase subunit sigma-24 [Pseudonocardia sp. HH130630-07]
MTSVAEPDPLALALARDLDAGFAELVARHRDLMFSVARTFARDPADAEDLAADALLRAYRALAGWPAARTETLAVRPWLLTVLRNTARNRARDAARRPAPPPAVVPVADRAATAPGPAEQTERDELQRRLGAALAELSEVQRTAVVLRHVQGLPTAEVAQVLGCREGTAKSHVSRGLARLRRVLDTAPSSTRPLAGRIR